MANRIAALLTNNQLYNHMDKDKEICQTYNVYIQYSKFIGQRYNTKILQPIYCQSASLNIIFTERFQRKEVHIIIYLQT